MPQRADLALWIRPLSCRGLRLEDDSFKLYARDIVRRPVRADFVTISTCYGAGARAYTGEGLVGLSWAFLRAGAHNVIAALWEASDAATPQLMDRLYGELDKGGQSRCRPSRRQIVASSFELRLPQTFLLGALPALQLSAGTGCKPQVNGPTSTALNHQWVLSFLSICTAFRFFGLSSRDFW